MRNNYRDDGCVWFDDQICELADLLLGTEGIKFIYLRRHDRTWIRRIGDDDMKYAVMSMTDIQIRIIEMLVFEDRTVTDIRRVLNITLTEFRTEIRKMRKALLAAM